MSSVYSSNKDTTADRITLRFRLRSHVDLQSTIDHEENDSVMVDVPAPVYQVDGPAHLPPAFPLNNLDYVFSFYRAAATQTENNVVGLGGDLIVMQPVLHDNRHSLHDARPGRPLYDFADHGKSLYHNPGYIPNYTNSPSYELTTLQSRAHLSTIFLLPIEMHSRHWTSIAQLPLHRSIRRSPSLIALNAPPLQHSVQAHQHISCHEDQRPQFTTGLGYAANFIHLAALALIPPLLTPPLPPTPPPTAMQLVTQMTALGVSSQSPQCAKNFVIHLLFAWVAIFHH